METLKAARALYNMGFAVHWLRPKSKIPLFPGWNNSPKRVPWEALEKTYAKGLNVGVRLGAPSEIVEGGKRWYLAVIDCDVKSTEPRHRAEMEARLRSEFGASLAEGPRVGTGRGNGSAHFYARTEKPVTERRVGQSADKVKVQMPSVKASASEISALTPDEVTAGWRLRAAWEITVMGNSRQVAAPPSVHPDSGQSYQWLVPVDGAARIPVLRAETEAVNGVGAGKRQNASTAAFSGSRPILIPVDLSKLSTRTIDLIKRGVGCEGDMSRSMMSAATSMAKAGYPDEEIVSTLLDPDHHWAGVAQRHVKSDDWGRAARWVQDYTVAKARRLASAANDFENNVVVSDLKPEAAEKQKAEFAKEREANWSNRVERSGPNGDGPPKNTLKNVITILNGALGPALYVKNDFTGTVAYGRKAPWGGKKGASLMDAHLALTREWFGDYHRFEPSENNILAAITCIAEKNSYHPVRDYLDQLEWDGTPRLDTWLVRYLGATPTPGNAGGEGYLSAVGRKMICAMVKRVYEPGAKFDYIPIFEGSQGIGKSTVLRCLASDEWFSDAFIDIRDKDAVLLITGVWLSELGELSTLNKSDTDLLKAFASRQNDKIRRPYGKITEDFPRQGIFVGTTNNREYLKDPTGNRRFWPVTVGLCDFEAIVKVRDQLFAEAKFLYENIEEALYMDRPEESKAAEFEQGCRLEVDEWDAIIREFFDDADNEKTFPFDAFKAEQLFEGYGPLAMFSINQHRAIRRVGNCLRRLGFDSKSIWVDRKKVRRWVK